MHSFPIASEDWVGIIDDDESVRLSLARLFRVLEIRAETFASADEFLGQTLGSPSCLVVDVQLGAGTGLALSDQLAARRLAVPPIVFMTAREDLATLQFVERHGAHGWLRKPLRLDALLALVRPHLRNSVER